jgi:hypothetical protein
MVSGFCQHACLTDLVNWTKPLHEATNWLFVTLDSARDPERMKSHLAVQLREAELEFWFGPEGLWLPGLEVGKPAATTGIIVPFSACYIFDSSVRACPKPSFNGTTDYGGRFTDTETGEVSHELQRLKALGFAADGCGLQYFACGPALEQVLEKVVMPCQPE